METDQQSVTFQTKYLHTDVHTWVSNHVQNVQMPWLYFGVAPWLVLQCDVFIIYDLNEPIDKYLIMLMLIWDIWNTRCDFKLTAL